MFKLRNLFVVGALALWASAASAAVTLSSIAVASGTVTVTTATAHGLTVNVGFCLSAPASVCAVAKTIPTSTTFTFDQPSNVTVAACASSCGTGDAAPRVIVLSTSGTQSTQTVTYLIWLTTLNPLPRAGAASAWGSASLSSGASAAQNNAIAAGSFIERAHNESFPAVMTTGQIQTFLQNVWTSEQAALAGGTQPAAFYGSVWDGLVWGQK